MEAVQHIAWLHTKASKSSSAKSRYAAIKERNPEDFRLLTPDCRAEYLLTIALAIGLSSSSGFGIQQMRAADIKAYNDVFKANVSIWEAEVLVRMSSAYVSAVNEYDGVDCLPPTSQSIENDRTEVANKLLQAFARRSQANKRSAPIGGRSNEQSKR